MNRADVLTHVLRLAESPVDPPTTDEAYAIGVLRDELADLVDPDPSAIKAAQSWPTNGHLIRDVAALWMRPTDVVVDYTFGKGRFWDIVKPERFTAHDLDPAKGDGVDWREPPERPGSVDVAVFDPPYVAPGGRETSTIDDMNDRYGMHVTEKDPMSQWAVIVGGIEAAHVTLRPGGLLWFKAMNYITNGAYYNFIGMAFDVFARVGFELVDWFTHVGGTGPQPLTNPCRKCDGVGTVGTVFEAAETCPACDGAGTITRRQEHARNNASVLLIARKVSPPVDQGTLL